MIQFFRSDATFSFSMSNAVVGNQFIYLFKLFICLFKTTTTQKRSRYSTDTVSEFHARSAIGNCSSDSEHCAYRTLRQIIINERR